MNDVACGLYQSKTEGSGFVAAVKKFCSSYWRLRGKQVHPPCRLLSALQTFGSHAGITKHKCKIRVQPTAIGRRHLMLVSGWLQ
jgi:hypothetical protein